LSRDIVSENFAVYFCVMDMLLYKGHFALFYALFNSMFYFW